MSRFDASLNLISVLDQLRHAYEIAKEAGHPELQNCLMTARRQVMEAVHQSLSLHSELMEVQEKLARAGENGSQPPTARPLRSIPDSVPRRPS